MISYDIIGAHNPETEKDYLVIILKNTAMDNPGYKIGYLVNEIYDLSEFNSAVMEKIAQSPTNLPEEKFILTYEEVEEEDEEEVEKDVEKSNDECQICLIIALLFGATLLAFILFLYVRLCR